MGVEAIRVYCDSCGKKVAAGTGAQVLKNTVRGCDAHPIRHLCERCYAQVFEKAIKIKWKERENG